MGRRRHERFRQNLTLRISGLDSMGNPFSQTASVLDVSQSGVRLDDVHVLDRPGRIITLDHRGNRAKYRVVWIGAEGLIGQAGLAALEPENPIFRNLPASSPDGYVLPESGQPSFEDALRKLVRERRKEERRRAERRAYQRYACTGEAELYALGLEAPDRGRLTDISRGGCFVELMAPIALNTKLEIVLRIAQCEIRGEGVVSSALPSFGVGIRFLHFEETQLRILETIIDALAQGKPMRAIAPNKPAAASPALPNNGSSASAQHLINAVLTWFGSNETLTRKEFLELLNKHTTARASGPSHPKN